MGVLDAVDAMSNLESCSIKDLINNNDVNKLKEFVGGDSNCNMPNGDNVYFSDLDWDDQQVVQRAYDNAKNCNVNAGSGSYFNIGTVGGQGGCIKKY